MIEIHSNDRRRRITLPRAGALTIFVYEPDGSLNPVAIDDTTLAALLTVGRPEGAETSGGEPFLEIEWESGCRAYIDRRRVPFATAAGILGTAIVDRLRASLSVLDATPPA